MKEAIHKKDHTVLYDSIYVKGKSIMIESVLVVARGQGREEWGVIGNGSGVSFRWMACWGSEWIWAWGH